MEKGLFRKLKFLFIFLFGIILFSTFSGAVDVTDCGYLNSADTTYVLQNNLTTTTTCFYINATNVTLDLNGYEIIYGNQDNSTTFYGIYSSKDYTNIKNGSVTRGSNAINSQDRRGIYLGAVDNGTVENMNLSMNGYGIYTFNSDRNILNNITANYNYYNGVYLYYASDRNNLSNIVTNYNNGSGIYLNNLLIYTVDYNRFENITSNSNGNRGIYVYGGDYTTLTNVISNSNGISGTSFSLSSKYPVITNITANDNEDGGVEVLSGADNCIVRDIIANGNTRYGLAVVDVINCTLTNITANNNLRAGITVQSYTENSTITNFTVNNNTLAGLYVIINVYNNLFENGIANSNIDTGVYFNNSYNNNLTNFTVSSNLINGFYFWNASTGNIVNNSVINNSSYGLYFQNVDTGLPESNVFYNNLINNTINTYNATALTNYFNTSSSVSTNIVGGTNSGGNYWGYLNGTGFSDTCADSDKNGICDLSYSFSGGIDYLPLAKENIPPVISLPIYTNLTLSNNASLIDLNIHVTDTLSSISKCFVNINGTNQTISASGNWCNSSSIYLTGLSEGNHQITVYANDSANNFALNNSYFIQIDNTIPALEINSPEAITYTTSYILFNITATDDLGVSSCTYSLDDNSNISLTNSEGNYWTRTPSVSDGSHDITFYCTDTSGNIASLSRSFTLDLPDEESSSGGSSSITQNASPLLIEKSVSIIWDKLLANEEKISSVSVEGIRLTKISLQTNKNISGASIVVKSISKTLHPSFFDGLTIDNVYQEFQINKTGFTNDDLKYVSFEFKIEKSWLGEKPTSSINLQRKDETSSIWERLNTTLLSSDSDYYYFKATSSGLSLFSIYFDEEICIPNELFCSGDSLKLCQENADSLLIEVCEFGCSEGKCLEYWQPDENESVFLRFTKLLFGTWLTFGTLVFSIIVAIVMISLILVSYVTFKYFERQGIFRRKI